MKKIPVGVSECLLGVPVRYDAGHKHDSLVTDLLGQYLDFQPLCPEVAIGLGVPRQPIRLIATDAGVHVRGTQDREFDVTDALLAEAEQVAGRLPDICGYIFMQKSPSCGLSGLKRYDARGNLLDHEGRGVYAGRLLQLMPWLPVMEARELENEQVRENFLARVFALHRQKIATRAPTRRPPKPTPPRT